MAMATFALHGLIFPPGGGGGGTPYIQMIKMVVVFFRGCNQRFGIFLGLFKQNPLKR